MKLFRTLSAICLTAALVFAAAPAQAQAPAGGPYQQVISANPFGLLLELFNAEYERVVGASSTAGIGGSFADFEDSRYFNADVFWRFYPQGQPLEGWAFGAKAGLTRGDLVEDAVAEEQSYLGFGFDANRSWLLGANNNFYVGVGFGLKRLVTGNADLEVIPTFRLVNVGIAF